MNKIEELKAAYEAATPGEWGYADDLSAVVVMGKYTLKAVADFGKIDNSAPDAEFIALAHNMMPELLEAVEQRDKLWQAIGIIGSSSGDFTQNVVNDALTDVGYYPEESPDEEGTT